jgi:hypothetical protein
MIIGCWGAPIAISDAKSVISVTVLISFIIVSMLTLIVELPARATPAGQQATGIRQQAVGQHEV